MSEEIKDAWQKVVEFNDKYFPSWRKKELIYLSNALAGEVGEVCNASKHLIGGGTNLKLTPDEYKNLIAEELVDTFIYMVLTWECIGFTESEFEAIFNLKLRELIKRMEARNDAKESESKGQ